MKPSVKLIGENGNAFHIIGKVVKTLRENNLMEEAEDFQQRAFNSKSYDEVLRLVVEYVEVQ